ncbi:MAG: hypothetical protein PVJ09_03635 [Candidatus Woesebacteria bacterium]
MPKLRFDQYLTILFICLFFLVQSVVYGQEVDSQSQLSQEITLDLIKPSPVAVRTASNSTELAIQDNQLAQLTAQSYLVIDLASSAILLEKEARSLRYPASTTKLMTALVAAKTYPDNRTLVVNKEAFTQGNTMGLRLKEQIAVKELLTGLLVASANDAAFVLASNHPLGYAGFVLEMNQMAEALHLENTRFTNPSGLDDQNHQSTAFDLAIISREFLKNTFLKELVEQKKIIVTDTTGRIKHYLYNTNDLLGSEEGVRGLKTGTTPWAGQVLITLLERDNHQILIVLMNSQDRYRETKEIIDWVFKNYHWEEIS